VIITGGRRALTVGSLALAALAALVVGAGPAEAHGGRSLGVRPTDWRSSIVGLEPAIPGVAFSLGDNGQYLSVHVSGRADVTIIGYVGEPFVHVTRNGVWTNQRSSTTWAVAEPRHRRPSDVDDRTAPRWKLVARTGRWRWHDLRTHTTSPSPASEGHGSSNGTRERSWAVPLLVDNRQALLIGRLVWVPGPSPLSGLIVLLCSLLLVASLGALRRWRLPLVAATSGLLAVVAAHLVGSVTGSIGIGVAYPVLMAEVLLVLLAFAIALARRVATTESLVAVAVISSLLFCGEGLPSLAVLWSSQAVTALPVSVDRFLVAVLAGGSVGLVIATLLALRATATTPARPLQLSAGSTHTGRAYD
jgi:hypothetical protein